MKRSPFPAFCLLLLLALVSCNETMDDKPEPVPGMEKAKNRDTPFIRSVPSNPFSPADISPMDVSYFPEDYPVLKMSKKITAPPLARVIYSRPQKQGRKIFGALLPYGEPWRLGANEATEIEFFRPVSIQNKRVNKGRYVLYCIPQKDTWTIVFNSNTFSWGLKQDPAKDQYRFEIPVQHSDTPAEYFTMVFQKSGTGADLLITWDDAIGRLPIRFS